MGDPPAPRTPEIVVLPDAAAVAGAAAETIARESGQAVARRGRFLLALSGGSTPTSLYRLLSSPAYDDQVPWRSTRLLWGDERCVAATDERSNFRLVAETGMLDRPLAGVCRMPAELPPEEGARRYEQTLRGLFQQGDPRVSGAQVRQAVARPPEASLLRIDLVLLGLGGDGHTASLFPGSPALAAGSRWVVAVEPQAGVARLTLSLPLLTAARHVLFLVTGAAKAAAVAQVCEDRDSPLPAARVLWGAARATMLLDEPASAGVPDLADGGGW